MKATATKFTHFGRQLSDPCFQVTAAVGREVVKEHRPYLHAF